MDPMTTDRAKLLERQRKEQADLQRIREESKQRTLAKRILQARENEKVADVRVLRKRPGACTRDSRRCPEARPPMLDTPECCKRHIRFVLRDVAGRLDEAGIRWWIDYGTLLGWMKYKGFIPYDKDCDLGILADDRAKLKALLDGWNADGFFAVYTAPKPTQRFRSGDRVKVCLSRPNHSNTDIFIWERDRPKKGYLDRINYIGADMYKGREFPISWALPLGRGKWDGIDVSLPAEPEKLVEWRYGPEWREPLRLKHPVEPRP